jgi:hypothetical protein
MSQDVLNCIKADTPLDQPGSACMSQGVHMKFSAEARTLSSSSECLTYGVSRSEAEHTITGMLQGLNAIQHDGMEGQTAEPPTLARSYCQEIPADVLPPNTKSFAYTQASVCKHDK